MKKVYKALALAASLFVGSVASYAQYWKYEAAAVEASSIQTGKDYALLPCFALSVGGNNFLAGERFTDSPSLVEANLYQFEQAGTTDKGEVMYYLKRKSGEYVAHPTNGQFYTQQQDRAWKLVVKAIDFQEGNYEYNHTETLDAGLESQRDTTIKYTGIDAYIWEARDSNNPEQYSFSTMSFTDGEGAVVLVDPTPVKADDPYSKHNFFLTYPKNNANGGPDKGADYARNSWVIYETEAMTPIEGLEAVMERLFGNDNLQERLKNYSLGTSAGEYSQEKYNTVLTLWQRAKEIIDASGSNSTAEEMNRIANELPGAYEAFINSGVPLSAGYYVVYSMRPNGDIFPAGKPNYPYGRNGAPQPEDYDDGAIYDGSAVNATDKNLRWSYKKDDAVLFTRSEIENKEFKGEHAKFVWKVTDSGQKDKSGNPLYFFQNVETKKYIGKDPARYSPIVMHDNPEVGYTISASKEFPGYFNFYSPALTVSTEGGSPSTAEYSGMHASSDINNVVAWDWRVGGSCWKVVAVTEAEINEMLEKLAPAKRLAALKELVDKSEKAVAAGKVYTGVDSNNQKIANVNSGLISQTADGLVTTADQLYCPMADSDEGQNIGSLVDGTYGDKSKGTFFHSTWHGGDEAWKKNHFLQMTLAQPEKEILIKWVKRFVTSQGKTAVNNNGAPLKVAIWGTNSESEDVLKAGKATEQNAEGEEVMNFDAWKKAGWDSLTVSDFDYPYEVKWSESETVNNAAGVAHFVLPNQYKHIRMEVISRVGNGDVPNGNRYFHGSELRVYRGAYDPSASVYEAVPQAVKDQMDAAIAAAKAKLAETDPAVSEEDVAALQAAYDNFMNNYPDPSKVKKAIADAEALVNSAEEGADLGYYAVGSKDEAKAVVDQVKQKLSQIVDTENRQPTVEEVNNLLAQLSAAVDAFNAKLQVPASGIYTIQSYTTNTALVGCRIVANTSSRKQNVVLEGRKQVNGSWADDEGWKEKLGAYWQVEKVEGGYTYKNLFTGLYLAPYTEDKNAERITQSETPYVFELQFAKTAGAFNLVAKADDVKAGTYIYVNAQPSSANLVTWVSASGRDNSAFKFEVASPENLLSDGFTYDVVKGKPQIITLPIAVKDAQGFYTVIGQDDQYKIQLKKVTSGNLEAGQAYVYIPTDEEATVILTPVATTLADLNPTHTEAAPVNGLVPTFETVKMNEQSGNFNSDRSKVLLSEANETAAANTGYFTLMPETTETGDAHLEANGKITTIGALITLEKAAKEGVYTISGIRVKNVKNLPAGLYIVNGQKALVK